MYSLAFKIAYLVIAKTECFFLKQPSKSSDSKSEKTKLDAKKLETNQSSVELLKRILSVLQIYIVSQLGCGSNVYDKNTAKKTANHWGY
jgi:hypothetical protein